MSLSVNVTDLATRIATEVKSLRTLINGNQLDLSALNTTAKSNLVAALNETLAVAQAGGGGGVTEGYVDDAIAAAVADLVNNAPEALDTLGELADALGDDPNFATTITNLIGTKADDSGVVKLTGAQTVAGVKTFSDAPVVPDGAFAIAKIIGLQAALDGKANATHTHAAADVTSGTFAPARLPAASETAIGAVERATVAEVAAGTDSTRYVSPAGLNSVTDLLVTAAEVGDTDADFVATFEAGLV